MRLEFIYHWTYTVEVTLIRPVLFELYGKILVGTDLQGVWRREIKGKLEGNIASVEDIKTLFEIKVLSVFVN